MRHVTVIIGGVLVVVALALLGLTQWAGSASPSASSPPIRNPGVHPPHSRARLGFRSLWSRSLAVNADSNPAYIAHPRGRSGGVVYTLAGNNGSNCNPGNPVRQAVLYAVDAASGRTLWSRSTAGPSRCTTAGPVADPLGKWVYAPGLDGSMHRYNSVNGRETRGHGWPERITLMPDVEKMPATPTISRGYLYVATSGFIGDQGHYEGHLVAIQLSSGKKHVFNSLCSNVHRLLGPTAGRSNYCPYVQSGLFGRGQGVTDPGSGDVYAVSGNGPWNGHTNWGDTIMKLNPGATRLLDAYTPTDQGYLNNSDLDLGSTGPALLPAIHQNGRTYHLLVQGGKGPVCQGCGGAALRLINRDNLSGKGGPGHLGGDLQDVTAPGGCEVLTAPAVWSHSGQAWVFYANDCGTAAYKVTSPSAGKFRLTRIWSTGQGGTTPVLAGGVLYIAHGGAVVAYAPATGQVIGSIGNLGDIHWEYPLVAGGHLFISDQSHQLHAYRISQ
jgi:outer membrane protein assembly factor BamB